MRINVSMVRHAGCRETERRLRQRIEELEEVVAALLDSVWVRGGNLSAVGSDELLRLATTYKAGTPAGEG